MAKARFTQGRLRFIQGSLGQIIMQINNSQTRLLFPQIKDLNICLKDIHAFDKEKFIAFYTKHSEIENSIPGWRNLNKCEDIRVFAEV